MTKTKMVIGTLTAVLALGVAAVSATSAVAAGWMVGGTELSGSAAISKTTIVDESFLLKAGSGIEIKCAGLEVENGRITAPNKDSTSSLIFTGCKGSSVCPIKEETIKTFPILSEATLEGALAASIIFRPESGTKFTNIIFTGSECSLSGEQPITGTAKALAPTARDERTLQLISPKTEANELKVGSSSAELKGSALLELESHKTWSLL
jgi:hypothetical protein